MVNPTVFLLSKLTFCFVSIIRILRMSFALIGFVLTSTNANSSCKLVGIVTSGCIYVRTVCGFSTIGFRQPLRNG